MTLWRVPAVLLPAGLCVCVVLTFILTVRLLKILRSVYLHNDFRLEPAAVYKCESPPSYSTCAKSFIPLYGAFRYSSPQFDLPTSSHLLLGFVYLSILWMANVGCAAVDEEFNVTLAVVAAVVATSVAMGMTYILHSRFVDNFNLQQPPDPISQSVTELNRRSPRRQQDGSTFIDTSVLPGRYRAQDIQHEQSPQRTAKASMEILLLLYVTVAVGFDFWSLSKVSSTASTAGTFLQWLLGVGLDLALRLAVCGILKVTNAVPNFAAKYYVIDYGLNPVQLHKFAKAPSTGVIEATAGPAPADKTPMDSFSQDQAFVPPRTPKARFSPTKSNRFHLPPIDSHHVPSDFAKDFDDFLDEMQKREEPNFESPGKLSKISKQRSPEISGNEPAAESIQSSSRVSQDTMPEVPHNMLSPVESPRGYSGMRFYRTPEKPYNASPERSPDKPKLPMRSPPRFELRLSEVRVSSSPSHSESEPESQFITYSSEARENAPSDPPTHILNPEDDEVYMVEFLPGGIIPSAELSAIQRDFPQMEVGGYRSQSLPKPSTAAEGKSRSKSGEKKPPTPRGPGAMLKKEMRPRDQSWVRSPTAADKARYAVPLPGRPSNPLYTEEDNPKTDDSLREISNTERVYRASARRKSRKEVEQTVEELLQAAKSHPENQEYERLAEILAARSSFRRKHAKHSVSPYNASLLGQLRGRDSANASRVILLEDPDAAARQAEHIQELSSIYGNSRPRSRPHAHSRESSRGRVPKSSREHQPE